jgi:hypothetical protein
MVTYSTSATDSKVVDITFIVRAMSAAGPVLVTGCPRLVADRCLRFIAHGAIAVETTEHF